MLILLFFLGVGLFAVSVKRRRERAERADREKFRTTEAIFQAQMEEREIWKERRRRATLDNF